MAFLFAMFADREKKINIKKNCEIFSVFNKKLTHNDNCTFFLNKRVYDHGYIKQYVFSDARRLTSLSFIPIENVN